MTNDVFILMDSCGSSGAIHHADPSQSRGKVEILAPCS